VGSGIRLVLAGLLIVTIASQGLGSEVCNDEFRQDFGDTVTGMSNDGFLVAEGCRSDKLKKLPKAIVAIRLFPKSEIDHGSHEQPQLDFLGGLISGEKMSERSLSIASNLEDSAAETIYFDFDSIRIKRDERKHRSQAAEGRQ
jgi:hypothetical protein